LFVISQTYAINWDVVNKEEPQTGGGGLSGVCQHWSEVSYYLCSKLSHILWEKASPKGKAGLLLGKGKPYLGA
jgi:hypothetical protein